MNEDAFRLPDPSRPIQQPIMNYGTASGWPLGNDLLVTKQPVFGWSTSPSINQRSIAQLQAVQISVVANNEQPVFPNRWREANGSTGEVGPLRCSCVCIKR